MSKQINMDEIKFADDETFKVFVRPARNRPMSAAQVQKLFEIIKTGSKIIYVPDGVEFVVIKKDGSAKVY